MHTILRAGRTLRAPRLGRSFGIALLSALRSSVRYVRHRLELARQRRHLALLDDHLLRDIGLSRRDIASESEKPFWRD
jgi:uncharacterized protein YjiS (DUF1127 family)